LIAVLVKVKEIAWLINGNNYTNKRTLKMTKKFTITDKVDQVTQVSPERLCLKPPPPKSIKIELVGGICSHKCKYCGVAQNLRKPGYMNFDDYKSIINEMVDLGIKEAGMFYLGESMLDKRLPQAIKYAKDAGIEYVFLTTNGKEANKEKVKQCMDAGLDSLKWSFNYADENQYEEITGVNKKHFHTIIRNIKDAYYLRQEHNYSCGLFASSVKYDDEQFEKMEKALKEIAPYVDEMYYLPLYSSGGMAIEDLELMGKKPVKGNFGRYGVQNNNQQGYCFALFSELRITYDNIAAGCCFNHDHSFDMGNVKEIGIMGAWHSQKYQDLRAAMLKGDMTGTPCEKCWTYTYE